MILVLSACRQSTQTPDDLDLGTLRLRMIPLEPATRSRITKVEWEAESDAGSSSGTASVDADAPIRFDAPGRTFTRFELRGYDAQGRLRAGGDLDAAGLVASTSGAPTPFLFHLYGEFQAFTDTLAPKTDTPYAYADSQGRIVYSNFAQLGVSRNNIFRFDPRTGADEIIGELTYRRWGATVLPLENDQYMIAGGYGGDLVDDETVEIWDAQTGAATLLPFTFANTYDRPRLVRTSNRSIWIFAQAATTAAEVIAPTFDAVTASTPVFQPQSGDVSFSSYDTAGGFERIRRYGGNVSGTPIVGVRVYHSNASGLITTEQAPFALSYPRVHRRSITPSVVVWPFYGDKAAIFPDDGDPAVATVFPLSRLTRAASEITLAVG